MAPPSCRRRARHKLVGAVDAAPLARLGGAKLRLFGSLVKEPRRPSCGSTQVIIADWERPGISRQPRQAWTIEGHEGTGRGG